MPQASKRRHGQLSSETGPSAVSAPDLMIVCSLRRWVADDMRTGAGGRFPVCHDFGFDLPSLPKTGTVAWWAPTEHAARLLRAGVPLDLSAPGPEWLAGLSEAVTGRPVWAGRLSELDLAPEEGWMKPAEAKVPGLPATWYSRDAFRTAAVEAGFPDDGWVQVSPVRLELTEEHRCFVLDGEVLTSSPYLAADGSTYAEGWETSDDFDHRSAQGFAQEVVDSLGDDQPSSYVLDVAKTVADGWVVVEANPAWCSGTYGCNLHAVVDVVAGSSAAPVGETAPSRHGRHRWQPDAYLTALANKQRLLAPRYAPTVPCLPASTASPPWHPAVPSPVPGRGQRR